MANYNYNYVKRHKYIVKYTYKVFIIRFVRNAILYPKNMISTRCFKRNNTLTRVIN